MIANPSCLLFYTKIILNFSQYIQSTKSVYFLWVKLHDKSPSLHFVLLIHFRALALAELILSQGERQSTSCTGHRSTAGLTETDKCSCSHLWPLSPINLNPWMCLECDGKSEYLERTHTSTGTTCKLYKERPSHLLDSNSGPSPCKATVLTTSLK